jgi:AcrR family transcriptional regulator
MASKQDQNSGPKAQRRGRPKDPHIEDKVLRAAAQLYGRLGWAGFSFDAVAREAGVGKSTLYARWRRASDLLSYLIDARWQALETIDTGRLESDLTAFAQLVLLRYRETGGGMAWHLRRDISTFPELAGKVGQSLERTGNTCVDILRRARERGELRVDVSLSIATELITAALEIHAVRQVHDALTVDNDDREHIGRLIRILRFGIQG